MGIGGQEGLYATAYYDDEKTFWEIYSRKRYDELKKKYDGNEVFMDLYAKCVSRR